MSTERNTIDAAELDLITRLPIGFNERHEAILGPLRNALTTGNSTAAWSGFTIALNKNCSTEERVRVVEAAQNSLGWDVLLELLDDALHLHMQGPPLSALDTIDKSARLWAAQTPRAELRVYLKACFDQLPPQDRERFLQIAPNSRAT